MSLGKKEPIRAPKLHMKTEVIQRPLLSKTLWANKTPPFGGGFIENKSGDGTIGRSQSFVRMLLMVMGYSEGLFLLFEFYSQNRRGWPDMSVIFRDSRALSDSIFYSGFLLCLVEF